MSNLKQIGLAVSMYLSDYDDYYPNPGYPVAQDPVVSWFPSALGPYVSQNRKVFKCPTSRDNQCWSASLSGKTYYFGYSMNNYIGRLPYYLATLDPTWVAAGWYYNTARSIPYPHNTMLIMDNTRIDVSYAAACTTEMKTARHNQNVYNWSLGTTNPDMGNAGHNYLFCDYHVEFVMMGKYVSSVWQGVNARFGYAYFSPKMMKQ